MNLCSWKVFKSSFRLPSETVRHKFVYRLFGKRNDLGPRARSIKERFTTGEQILLHRTLELLRLVCLFSLISAT